MKTDTILKTTAPRRPYERPLITCVASQAVVLLEATTTPDVPIRPEPGEEALSKETEFHIDFNIGNDSEEEEEEAPG